MPDSDRDRSPWHIVWTYVRAYWHWPVLLVMGIYVYQQYMPSIELAAEGRPAPTVAAETLEGDRFRLEDHRGGGRGGERVGDLVPAVPRGDARLRGPAARV
ncbi:hypothetical protein [Salinibacter ruber]|uniref:hypothetical protein n=1 Tax=Salinibacter ruber TaxID=146919 RepID=UPI002168E441|nr:hypothetical protein [Salinibacter ruber]MCS4200578.1 hypothetical protein [Salinibacter ruber]